MEDLADKGKKRTSSALDVEEGKEDESSRKFGSRLLNEEADVFSQNAW